MLLEQEVIPLVCLVEKHPLEKFPFLEGCLPFWASSRCVTWCALFRRAQHSSPGCSSCSPQGDISKLQLCFSMHFTHSPGLSWPLLCSGSTHTPSMVPHTASESTLSCNFRAEIKKRERGTLTGPWEERLILTAAKSFIGKLAYNAFLEKNRKSIHLNQNEYLQI